LAKKYFMAWLAAILLAALAGCGGPPVPMEQPPDMATMEAPAPLAGVPDQVLLEEGLKGRALSPAQVAGLSERMLAEGNSSLNDEKTMARLELLLLKALKGGEDKTSSPILWRNLGIIHFHQKKYDRAQQELKKANEFNPRDARIHYYLARLLSRQADICQRKGLKKKARGLAKQAATEMELARKFAPNNPTYRQDLKPATQPELGK
jgi:tetratricopeptide (TPR) repeat protein